MTFHLKRCLLNITACALMLANTADGAQETMNDARFGKITLYHPAGTPHSLVLFISGDGGWQLGVIGMARHLLDEGALVAGIDMRNYFTSLSKQRSSCVYPAADFEQLSMKLQRKYHFDNYQKPILAGYSSGATLVYLLLAQAPAGTFGGGISLGFCPDIRLPRPPCKGNGLGFHMLGEGKGYYLEQVKRLPAPFIVLNGTKDQVCSYAATAAFLKGMGNAKLITLPAVGHGFSADKDWVPEFRGAYRDLIDKGNLSPHTQGAVRELKTDLPIKVIPAHGYHSNRLLFFISGDGGWTGFDQSLADAFAREGVSVVGLDAQKYFWKVRTPEETSREIGKLLDHYIGKNTGLSVCLMGYSFGACIVPFVANRLSSNTRSAVKELVLLAPDQYGDFEIHVSDMLNLGNRQHIYDAVRELTAVTGMRKLCLFGEEEDAAIPYKFQHTGAVLHVLAGGHHFNNDFKGIAENVLTMK